VLAVILSQLSPPKDEARRIKFWCMQRAIILALLLFFPTVLHARLIKWERKPVSISISTERLTRIEFPENLRSVFLSRSDIAVEWEEKSLYVRAVAPEVKDTLFVGGETGLRTR
jgi:hypothetical protein